MNMKCVYLITNLVTGKVYVGQTKNFAVRKAGHLYSARQGLKRPLYDSIRKHGESNFKFEIIEECDDAAINDREKHWVAHYDSFNPEKGYNLTSGGEREYEVSDDIRKQISESLTGRERSEEHCTNISVGKKGKPNGLKGRKQSLETIQKRIETFKLTGCRKGVTAWNKGMIMPEEIHEKACNGRRNKEPWNKGLKLVDRKRAS